MRSFGYYINRTLCDVLEEIRKLDNTKNYSSLAGLVEEAQSMANRMEAVLNDIKDLRSVREDVKTQLVELRRLEEKVKELTDIVDESVNNIETKNAVDNVETKNTVDNVKTKNDKITVDNSDLISFI